MAARGKTVHSEYYIEILEELGKAIQENHRRNLAKGVLLMQDNASPHSSERTQAALRDLQFETLPHPPYSPDLSPCDYWLFGPMKKYLKGRRFENLQQLSSSVSQWVRSTPETFFRAGIEKLPERWEKCIRLLGDFVELPEAAPSD